MKEKNILEKLILNKINHSKRRADKNNLDDGILEFTDFSSVDHLNMNAAMYVFFNKDGHEVRGSDLGKALLGNSIDLGPEEIEYLVKNSDLSQLSNMGESLLMFALEPGGSSQDYNSDSKIKINSDIWDYIIDKCNLTQRNAYGYSPLMIAIKNNQNDIAVKITQKLIEKYNFNFDYFFKTTFEYEDVLGKKEGPLIINKMKEIVETVRTKKTIAGAMSAENVAKAEGAKI